MYWEGKGGGPALLTWPFSSHSAHQHSNLGLILVARSLTPLALDRTGTLESLASCRDILFPGYTTKEIEVALQADCPADEPDGRLWSAFLRLALPMVTRAVSRLDELRRLLLPLFERYREPTLRLERPLRRDDAQRLAGLIQPALQDAVASIGAVPESPTAGCQSAGLC